MHGQPYGMFTRIANHRPLQARAAKDRYGNEGNLLKTRLDELLLKLSIAEKELEAKAEVKSLSRARVQRQGLKGLVGYCTETCVDWAPCNGHMCGLGPMHWTHVWTGPHRHADLVNVQSGCRNRKGL